MPEVWVTLNIADEIVPDVLDLDLSILAEPTLNKELQAMNLKTVEDMYGMTQEDWAEEMSYTPEEHQYPWEPEKYDRWTSATDGLKWIDAVERLTLAAVIVPTKNPSDSTYPHDENVRSEALRRLSDFRSVLQRAQELNADFRVFYGS